MLLLPSNKLLGLIMTDGRWQKSDRHKVFRKAGDMEDNSNAVRLKHFFAVLLGRGKWLSKIMQVELRRPFWTKKEKNERKQTSLCRRRFLNAESALGIKSYFKQHFIFKNFEGGTPKTILENRGE